MGQCCSNTTLVKARNHREEILLEKNLNIVFHQKDRLSL